MGKSEFRTFQFESMNDKGERQDKGSHHLGALVAISAQSLATVQIVIRGRFSRVSGKIGRAGGSIVLATSEEEAEP